MTKKDHLKQSIIRALHIFPIQDKSIFCHNFYGNGYDENPKYIADELRKKGFKIYWALSRPNANLPLPDNVERVIVGTPKYFYAIATSKIWISNVRLPLYFTKRKKQYYIQTWHGDLGMKKIEYDVADKLTDTYQEQMKLDNSLIDYFTSGSHFFTERIRQSFKYDDKIFELGQPKYDPVINSNHEFEKQKLKQKLNISEDNLILYMPTFRVDYSHDPYNIDLDSLKKTLEKKYHNSWKILCKMHPNVEEKNKKIHSQDYESLDNYGDTQGAIIASDLIITDYSSVMFDAMLANRSVYIYANDEKNYTKNERGLYFKLTDLPFPYFKNNSEMINYTKNNSLSDAKRNYQKFIVDQGVFIEGKAAQKIAKEIEKLCLNTD